MKFFFDKRGHTAARIIPSDIVTRALGKDITRISLIRSIAFALISVFYIYTIGSYLKMTIYVFHSGVTYERFFIDLYIINKNIDQLIIASGLVLWLVLSINGKARFALPAFYGGLTLIAVSANLETLVDFTAIISIPIMVSVIVYNAISKSKKRVASIHISTSLNHLAILGTAIGIFSIVVSVAPIFSISLAFRNYAYEIFILLSSSFSSICIIVLSLAFPFRLLMNEFLTRIKSIYPNTIYNLSSKDSVKIRTRNKIIYLVLFMLLSVTLALIPHQPSINKNNQQIGVDTHYYVDWVNALIHSNGTQSFLEHAFGFQGNKGSFGDRPLVLITLFTISKIVNADLSDTIEYVPILLGPALVLAIYLLTRELMSNDTVSLMASFLTAMSFQVLIGIYAGFYANWMALIIGYLCFVFLFRFLKSRGKLSFIMYSALVIILLFIHVYTWSIFVMVMVIFLLVMLKLNHYQRKDICLLLAVISFSVIIDIARVGITGPTSGIIRDMEIAARLGVGSEQFLSRWSNLIYTTYYHYGGQFNNIIILMLGIFWLSRANLKEVSSIFLLIFLSMGSFPLFFGDYEIENRIRYDIPFQIPAAIALTYMKKEHTNGAVFSLLFCVWLLGISIRAVSNFYLILP